MLASDAIWAASIAALSPVAGLTSGRPSRQSAAAAAIETWASTTVFAPSRKA